MFGSAITEITDRSTDHPMYRSPDSPSVYFNLNLVPVGIADEC
jgi:hypothetical protein